MMSTLHPLPCPVSLPPAGGKNSVYVTFHETQASYGAFASDSPLRMEHMVQVHVYGENMNQVAEVLAKAVGLLKAARIRIRAYGADYYEESIKRHHKAVTCVWVERLESEEKHGG